MLLKYWEHTESHAVIEMLQSLLVCHSRPSAGSLFLSYSVQLLQKRLHVEQRGIAVSCLSWWGQSISWQRTCKIPHTMVYSNLIALQIANGDGLLEEHLTRGASNAQYTLKFSAVMLLETLDTWLERKQLKSLKSSPCILLYLSRWVSRYIHTERAIYICCR